MKKVFYTIAFTLMLFLFYSEVVVYAGGSDPGGGLVDKLVTGEKIKVELDGTIRVTNYDRIATSTTRYGTIGYTVKRSDAAIGKTDSFMLPLTAVTTIKNENDGKPIPEHPEIAEGYMLSIDKLESGKLYDQADRYYSEWAENLYKGSKVYLDGVMVVKENNRISGSIEFSGGKYVKSGRVYLTFEDIRDARAWRDKNVLITHFNKEVYLPPITTDIGFIDAELTATANPGIVQQGVTTSVQVTLDSSESRARYKTLDMPAMKDAEITSRRFWVLSDGVYKEVAQEGGIAIFNVDNVTSQTVLTCRVRVYSKELADLGLENIPYLDEETKLIYLGQQGTSNAQCNLGADQRGSEKFNVLQGIPTTETLYANITTEEYLLDLSTARVAGTRNYAVSVTRNYNLQWQENGVTRTSIVPVTLNYVDENGNGEIERNYVYHVIDAMGLYGIDRVEIKNGCLPGGSVTIKPSNGYKLPAIEVLSNKNLDNHIKDPEYKKVVTLEPITIKGGDSKPSVPRVTKAEWREYAEAAVGKVQVRNDKLIIDGYTVLDDRWDENGNSPDPNEIPKADMVGNDILFKSGIQIDAKTLNGDYGSTGLVYYTLQPNSINATQNQRVEGIRVNNVIVHTPVVCDPTITSDTTYNQEIKPDSTRAAMILGRTTQLNFPTIGKYINKKGYTGADLRKYTQERIVKFPFDVYINKEFYKAGTEYHMPMGVDTIDVTVPTWVDENNYEVECRAIAINSPGNANLRQDLANISYTNYIAEKKIPVRVIGRIYGFKLTDINDYPDWAGVFRTDANTSKHSGNYYWVGGIDQDGQVRGNKEQFTLPVLNGSHTTKTNLGVIKKGYKFKYDFTTIGNYFNDKDCVRIKPTFYYVKKDGTGKQEVDLWYTEKVNGINKVIKVGSNTDINNIRNIVLGEPYRNVPDVELNDTSRILGITKNEFTNQKAKLGSFGDIILTKPLRTFIGNTSNIPAGVDADRVKKSVQKWYGEYWIPDNTFACPKGYNVGNAIGTSIPNGKEGFWLKDGYIIVNFEIETLKNADIENPQLSYWNNPNSNMWKIEGFKYTKNDSSGKQFTLKDGDIIFYYTDKKSLDDYSSGGTN
jgi:hypothetical protein